MSMNEQARPNEAQKSWWMQTANQWDVFKFLLPFMVLVSFWAVRIEVNQARTDSKFEACTQTLKDVEAALKSLNDAKDERGQRMARVEAKIDIVMQQQMMQQQKANKE